MLHGIVAQYPAGALPGNVADVWDEKRATSILLPPAFRKLQDQMLRKSGPDRETVDIQALVLHHDEHAVLTAVEMALAAGLPTKTHVLNRLVDGKVVGGSERDCRLDHAFWFMVMSAVPEMAFSRKPDDFGENKIQPN